jgi:hypothetical protein
LPQTIRLYRRTTIVDLDDLKHRSIAKNLSWFETLLIYVWRVHPSFLELAHNCNPINLDERRLPGILAIKIAKRLIHEFNLRQPLRLEIGRRRIDLLNDRFGYVLDLAIGDLAQQKKDHNEATRRGLNRRDDILDDNITNAATKMREAEAIVADIERRLFS